jgi:hypothetical protein
MFLESTYTVMKKDIKWFVSSHGGGYEEDIKPCSLLIGLFSINIPEGRALEEIVKFPLL